MANILFELRTILFVPIVKMNYTMGKQVKAERAFQLLRPPDEAGPGVFSISKGDKSIHYAFREIPCEIGGRGFALHRLGLGEMYHVRIGKPAECQCDCLGFLAHGRCKHIQGLRQLIERDTL